MNKQIGDLPINNFVLPAEAANILNISVNSIGKLHDIHKRKLVYTYHIGTKCLYNKKSLLLYKKTGDGRFILEYTDSIPYILQQPGFMRCLYTCVNNIELVMEFDRLQNSNLCSLSSIEGMIDDATSKLDDDLKKFILFVNEYVYKILK